MLSGTLDNLIKPRSVAVLGVSDSRVTWGSKALRLCAEGGYRGRLYGVNPRGALAGFEGFSIVEDLSEVEPPLDCVLIGLERDRVLGALMDCVRNGAKSAVIVAAGFGELGSEGQLLEARLLEVARAGGLRILGPNCIGLFRADGGACFTPFAMPPGPIGLISQSGNVAISLGLQARRMGFGFSTCVGVGNQLDIAFGEVLCWFADDPATSSVAMYIEGVPPHAVAEFIEGLRRCQLAGKPVYVLRGGTTLEGSGTVGTHTGSLASDARVWSAIVEGSHAISVTSESALADALLAAQLPRFGRGVAVLTDGGGNSVMAVDSLSRLGVPLASLSAETQAELLSVLPRLAPRHEGLNPVTMDTPGGLQDGPMLMATCAELCARDPSVGALVIGGLFGGFQDYRDEEIAAAKRLAAIHVAGTPIAVASAYSGIDEISLSVLRDAGVPVYGCMGRLASAISSRYLARQGNGSDRPLMAARRLQAEQRGNNPGWLTASESIQRLSAAGLPCPPLRVVRLQHELDDACGEIGFPLCVKIDAEDLPHKSDVGGVKLGLLGPADASAAAAELWLKFPAANLLVMPMFAPGLELLVGMSWDPTFGPVIAVGRGGIWTEVENDVVVLPAALSDAVVGDELSKLRCFPMMSGTRGQPQLDLDALIGVVSALGNLADDAEQFAVDLNPVILYEHGLAIADFRVRVVGER